eukprot:863312-Prorocentrum_minimum.AAC.1
MCLCVLRVLLLLQVGNPLHTRPDVASITHERLQQVSSGKARKLSEASEVIFDELPEYGSYSDTDHNPPDGHLLSEGYHPSARV